MSRLFVFFVASTMFAGSALAAPITVDNHSFESFVNGSDNDNDPATFSYPEPTDWTYSGTAISDGLLGVISDSVGTIPDTPEGNNWLLMDSRTGDEHLYQDLGTIALGDVITLTALIGRVTSLEQSDFEVALYRSGSGSGTPDVLLADINNTDVGVAALGLGEQIDASVIYNAILGDVGEALFVRIGLKTLDTINPAEQTLVDNIRVDVVNVVPEPQSLALLGLGLLGIMLGLARRSRR